MIYLAVDSSTMGTVMFVLDSRLVGHMDMETELKFRLFTSYNHVKLCHE
jgi:hypothetical protein